MFAAVVGWTAIVWRIPAKRIKRQRLARIREFLQKWLR